jgi:peptide/nickel transport system substrate-binding protein
MTSDREHPYIPKLKAQLAARKTDRREFLRTATLLGLSATAAYCFADVVSPTGGAAHAQQPAPKPKGGTLRIAMRCQKIDSPHTYSWVESSNSARCGLDYLTRTGADNVTRPMLLEGWEASEDVKTWTLRLRRDVKWRKGRLFTADDVVWNLKRVADAKTGSSMVGLLKGFLIEDVDTGEMDDKGKKKMSSRLWDANAIEKIDDFTVRLNGKAPQLAVPEQLYHYPMLIMEPAENGVFEVGSNGTGPFELVENTVGRKQVWRARRDYWGDGPYVDQLEFIDLGDDPAATVAALASGQVDLLYTADIPVLPALERIPNCTQYRVDTAFTAVVRMQPDGPFADKRVRQAVQLATNREAVLQAAHRNLGRVAEDHHVAPVHPEYAPMPTMKRDVAKAKQLLAEAGHANGIDVELNCKATPAWEPAAAQLMVEQWKEAGIRAKLNIMPATQYWEVWTKVPFGFTTWTHRPLGVMTLGLAYRTGVPWNESRYSNPTFDQLLSEADGIVDVTKRQAVMAKLQAILLEDAPITIPIWRSLTTFAHKRVVGYGMHPSQYLHAADFAVQS